MALAVSSLTSLKFLTREQFWWRKPRNLCSASGFFSRSASRRGVRVAGSSSGGGYGAVSEIESQRSSFVWPDNKKVSEFGRDDDSWEIRP